VAGLGTIDNVTENGWDGAEINFQDNPGQEYVAYAAGNIQGQEINWWHMTHTKQLTEHIY
jgi:hypothetical protein